MIKINKNLSVCILSIITFSCAIQNNSELKTVEYLDLDQFMGDWFVISVIPTFLEKDIYNAIESYSLNSDGTVSTEFSFNKGDFNGERKTYNPKGFILDQDSNALWGMQFLWPIKACLWLGILFLLIQGISELFKSYYAWKKGKWPDA